MPQQHIRSKYIHMVLPHVPGQNICWICNPSHNAQNTLHKDMYPCGTYQLSIYLKQYCTHIAMRTTCMIDAHMIWSNACICMYKAWFPRGHMCDSFHRAINKLMLPTHPMSSAFYRRRHCSEIITAMHVHSKHINNIYIYVGVFVSGIDNIDELFTTIEWNEKGTMHPICSLNTPLNLTAMIVLQCNTNTSWSSLMWCPRLYWILIEFFSYVFGRSFQHTKLIHSSRMPQP